MPSSTPDSRIAALLSVLSASDDALQCPLAVFARTLREAFWTHIRHPNGIGGASSTAAELSDVLAERSLELLREEETILRDREVVRVAYDKLRAEMARVEAQLQSLEKRAREVLQQKAFCKLAMNLLVTGEVPELLAPANDEHALGDDPREECEAVVDTAVANTMDLLEPLPEVAPMSSGSPKRTRRGNATSSAAPNTSVMGAEERGTPHAAEAKAGGGPQVTSPPNTNTPTANANTTSATTASPTALSSPRGAVTGPAPSGNALLAMLRLPDMKETTLLHAIESYDHFHFGGKSPAAWSATSAQQQQELLPVLLGLLRHLPQPRPPVQLAELRVLGHVLRAANPLVNGDPATSTSSIAIPPPTSMEAVLPLLQSLLNEGRAVATLTRLLQSVNDEIKCEVLECLSSLVMGGGLLAAPNQSGNRQTAASTTHASAAVTPDARKEFLAAGGLQPLVSIVASCTSEAVLERSLVLLWGLISRNDDEEGVREDVRRLGGLRAVLDLLYTDSMPILENVAMTIGYITREEASKVDVRESGGLEKITATLRHPSESIQTKMAGAVWNCASNAENRTYLRQIGCIPALLELLSSPFEFVRENAAGALWNLSVDPENKAQILDYGGISELAQIIAKSSSVSVVENASGTLWNCSAAVETRPAIRKAGAIPILLSVLDRKPMDAVNAQQQQQQQQQQQRGSKKLLRVGGKDQQALPMSDKILDNVAGTLRNCAINDQNKPAIREAGGVELLLSKLQQGLLLQPCLIPMPTLDKMASTLWILTISPEIKHSVRLSGGIPILTKILEASSATAARKSTAPLSSSSSSSTSSPTQRPILLTTSVKEKIVGILRNCSTVQENRPVMVSAGVVRALVHVVEDCQMIKPSTSPSASFTPSNPQQPSLQLKETVASALWYLSRDDKVVPREEGGLELLCRMLRDPSQPSVVLEQAAGALSSLTVNSQENRSRLREYGGLQALMRMVEEKAPIAFPQTQPQTQQQQVGGLNGTKGTTTTVGRAAAKGSTSANSGNSGSKADNAVSHTYAVLNALLAIRNSTSSNEENLRIVAEWRRVEGAAPSFTAALLYIIQHGSEDCAREAALCVKNLCGHAKAVEQLLQQDAVEVLGGLAERGSTDSVRRAAAMTLHSLARAQRR